MKFSVYDKIQNATQPTKQITLAEAYGIVSKGTYKTPGDVQHQVERLRAASGKPKAVRDELKRGLPLFVFSCEMEGNRDSESRFIYSQYMCVDIDGLTPEQVTDLFEKFKAWGVVHLAFVSPSGNGFKAVFSVNTSAAQHKQVYTALMLKIRDTFGIPLKTDETPYGLDTVCKDIARACYMSHDATAYYDEVAPEIDAKKLLTDYSTELAALEAPKKSKKKKAAASKAVTLTNDTETIEYIVSECEVKNISLSNCHADNIAIGWSLLSVGADADYFHRITRLNPDYDFKRMDDRYKSLAKSKKNEYSLGTLVFRAIKAGVVMPSNSLNDIDYTEKWLTSQHEFRTNEISGKVEYRAAARDEGENTAKWQPLEDFKLNEWSVELKRIRLNIIDSETGKVKTRKLNITKAEVFDITHRHNFSPAVNPITERFKQLHGRYVFGGTNTLSEVKKWCEAFNYGNSEYAESFWLDWFGGVIQNLTTDGYYDKILVLSGTGGEGKTFAIKERLGAPFSEYFTQSFNWSSNKDDLSKITKYLFILDDELNTSRKADVEQIKNITSISHTDIREAYARFDSRRARIANFIATTNNREFLTDLTGNRRFLVLDVVTGNRDIVNSIDYSKLWAEVWQYFYIEKNTSTLDNATINGNNESFRQISVEEEALDECFDFSNVASGGCHNADFVVTSVKEIIDFINSRTGRKFIEDARISKKLKDILNSKGVIQSNNIRHEGKQGRWWFLKVKKRDCDNPFVAATGGFDFSEN